MKSDRGIFCVECHELAFKPAGIRKVSEPSTELVLGTRQLTRATSAAVLGLLSKPLKVPILSCRVATLDGLTQVIQEWAVSKKSRFPILWLAGRYGRGFRVRRPNGIPLRTVGLDTLTQVAKEIDAQGYAAEDISGPHTAEPWRGGLVHFSAYATLQGKRRRVYDLINASGLCAVSGYSRDSDWAPTVAFENLYVKFLKEALSDSTSAELDENIVDRCQQRLLDSRMCSGLIEHLGFQIIS